MKRTILLNYIKIEVDTDMKIILLDRQHYVGSSSWLLEYQNFLQHCSCLSVLHNYFDSPIKLFSDLYLAKFLDFRLNLRLNFNEIIPSV